MFRIGCVSYLNAKPLIFGLDADPEIDLQLDVPARLLDGLIHDRFDVALLPTIDYQRMENLALLPVGGIGSEDETLTVRIFSKVPIPEIRSLSCDAESHTSVALARIILKESFHIHPDFTESQTADAQLLIGDKVITDFSPSPGTPGESRGGGIFEIQNSKSEIRNDPYPNPPPEYQGREKKSPSAVVYPHQLDLGSAWRELTGLPFLFACWTTRRDANLGDLPARLLNARQRGLANIPTILQRDATPRGWSVEIARKYLTQHLSYEVGPRQLQAVRLFHDLAARHGLISTPRPLTVIPFQSNTD